MIKKPGMIESWKMYGLSVRKVRLFIFGCSFTFAVLSLFLSVPLFGPGAGLLVGIMLGGVSGYVIAMVPKRDFELSALLQAREAPTMAASFATYLEATGSKAKTIMMARSDEPRTESLLEELKRRTLQGKETDSSELERLARGRIFSDSTMKVIRSIVLLTPASEGDSGDELDSIMSLAETKEEEKLTGFMTFAFFLPFMGMLALAISHHFTLQYIIAFAILETLVLDLALVVVSTERKRLAL